MNTYIDIAVALIASLEGVRNNCYRDSGGVLTIGIGHTGPIPGIVLGKQTLTPLTLTMPELTDAQVTKLFQFDVERLIFHVEKVTNLSNVGRAALLSFGFNCGLPAMLKAIVYPDEILKPIHCTDRFGHVLSGLQQRRKLESVLLTHKP